MASGLGVPLSYVRRAVGNYVFKRPWCVSFELTYNCNARCQHCHRGGPVPNERLAGPQRLLEICREVRPLVAIMSGGEPLLRKELETIVRTLKGGVSPLRVFVNTNAALLAKERFSRLRQAGVDEFLISLDFPDERHDEWRGIPGLFEWIKARIAERLPEERKNIVLTSVFQRRNYREAPRMAEIALEWGVNINFSAYTWLRTNDRDLLIPPEEIGEFREITRTLLALKRKHGHILTSDWVVSGMIRFFQKEGIPDCRAGERSMVVNPDGAISPFGLLIKDYPTREAMLRAFPATNPCTACYTSTRANSERPARHLLLDHLACLWRNSARGDWVLLLSSFRSRPRCSRRFREPESGFVRRDLEDRPGLLATPCPEELDDPFLDSDPQILRLNLSDHVPQSIRSFKTFDPWRLAINVESSSRRMLRRRSS